MKTYMDLSTYAKRFANLEEFEDFDGLLHRDAKDAFEDKRCRNIVVLRDGRSVAARFYLFGQYRYLAYAPFSRLGDLARFADVLFGYLREYRVQYRHCPVNDSDLTFSVTQSEYDRAYFQNDRPDVQALIDAIVAEVKDAKETRDAQEPSWRSKSGMARITEFFARMLRTNESYFQALKSQNDDMAKRLHALAGDMAKRLDALEHRLNALAGDDTAKRLDAIGGAMEQRLNAPDSPCPRPDTTI